MVRNPTYGVLSQRQYCRELHAQGGGGGSQKVTNDDEREGGVTIPPKIDDVIYEQPLTKRQQFLCNCIRSEVTRAQGSLEEKDLLNKFLHGLHGLA